MAQSEGWLERKLLCTGGDVSECEIFEKVSGDENGQVLTEAESALMLPLMWWFLCVLNELYCALVGSCNCTQPKKAACNC
jgi:hypothetical protein